MGVRRAWLGIVLVLIADLARASDHRYAAFIGPSYLDAKGSSLKLTGLHLGGEATVKIGDCKRLALAGDLSVNSWGGSEGTTNPAQITFTAGPRWAFLGKKENHNKAFVHVMVFGLINRSGTEKPVESATAFAFGVGYDWAPGKEHWGSRIQIDWLQPYSSDVGHGVRVSLGLLYRFKIEE